ncbi:MAG: DUF488 domain-containing protein [Pseudomonadota bacterium]|nr:DUF488 domain-containing protein [Pseudomonadota bacterium]
MASRPKEEGSASRRTRVPPLVPPLYTIGYEGQSLDSFIGQLQAAGVQQVADVRQTPISRKPGFAKTPLSTALKEAGISYVHLRALGCPKGIRDRYRQERDWDRYTQDFLAHLGKQAASLDLLIESANQQQTAVLCFETDFNRCHRTYVARAAGHASGARVLHITAAGIFPDAPSPTSARVAAS